MRFLTALIIAATVGLSAIVPANAQMEQTSVSYTEKPLLIIRWNQQRVYFTQALNKAVSSAESAKHNMIYRVVGYMPETMPSKLARAYLRSVVEGIRLNGVPLDRISWRSEVTSGSYPEIHVYVQ